MEDISEVSEQSPKSSNVASTSLQSIETLKNSYVTVTVASELVIYLMVTPCLNKGS